MLKKYLPFFLLALITFSPTSLFSKEELKTLQGVLYLTKGGYMVQGVVMEDNVIPKGQNINAFVGKTVEVKGYVQTQAAMKEPEGPKVQFRQGPYDYFKKVESIKVVGEKYDAHQ